MRLEISCEELLIIQSHRMSSLISGKSKLKSAIIVVVTLLVNADAVLNYNYVFGLG